MSPSFSSTSLNPDNLDAGGRPEAKAVPITLLSGATVVRGHLLGRITIGGKYIVSLNAAVDGSEVARAVAAEAMDASLGDKTMLAYLEGNFNQDQITFGTGQTIANTKADLQDVNIYLVDPVTKTPA